MAERLTAISIKIEVVDTDSEHSWNVQGLCSACLCATRTTHLLTDAALKKSYEDILADTQYQCGISPRLCWECVSVLRRATNFRERVKESHDTLHSMMQTCDVEKIDNDLIGNVTQPSRLRASFGDSVDIWPQYVMNDKTNDNHNEDAAADNNSYRHEHFATAAANTDEFRHEDFRAAENNIYHQEDYTAADNGGYRVDEFNAGAADDMNNDDDDCGQMMEPLVQIKEEDVSDHDALDPADALECELREEPYSADYDNEDCEGTSGLVQRNNITTLDEKTIMTLTLLKCTRCVYTTISAQALERHSHLHDSNRPFQCEICHKGFNRTDGLKRHMTTHTREKNQYDETRIYECKVCKKKLTRKTHLKDHMRTHTGEKPFLCSICKRGFSSTCDLTRHWRTHTKEKPYQCSVCQKGFTSSGDWKKHMRIHTGERPYQCTICDKGCTNSNGLKLHMRTHTGEKPYECTVCQKRFTSTSDLARHGKTHTKEKPYECTICHKHFSRSGGLKVHMSKHVPSTTIAVT